MSANRRIFSNINLRKLSYWKLIYQTINSLVNSLFLLMTMNWLKLYMVEDPAWPTVTSNDLEGENHIAYNASIPNMGNLLKILSKIVNDTRIDTQVYVAYF